MVHKFISESGKDWPQWVPFLLFAVWEVPQASVGFFQFKLLYNSQPREWETPAQMEEAPVS